MTVAGSPDRFTLRVTGPAARALAGRLPEKIATAAYEFMVTALLDNPHRVGKRLLLPPYAGTWSARRGSYRILYEIDEEQHFVTVTAVEHRGRRVPVEMREAGRGCVTAMFAGEPVGHAPSPAVPTRFGAWPEARASAEASRRRAGRVCAVTVRRWRGAGAVSAGFGSARSVGRSVEEAAVAASRLRVA